MGDPAPICTNKRSEDIEAGVNAGDEVGDGLEGTDRAVAAGLGLGGLDEGVDALDETVGNMAVEPGEDAAAPKT